MSATGYGIFDSSLKSAIDYTTFVSLKIDATTTVSTFPVEQGGFATYNKASHPYKLTVQVAKEGDTTDIINFLATLDTLKRGTALLSITTPERTFINANLSAYDYARDSRHRGMVVANLHFTEVRQVQVQYATTKSPAAQNTKAGGKTQASRWARKRLEVSRTGRG